MVAPLILLYLLSSSIGNPCLGGVDNKNGRPLLEEKCYPVVRYPDLKVDEDPFTELPSDAEVLAPADVPFDDCLATPLALPPPS
ncbi:hypothetical protein B296_00014743 [Ensete ventricosum]|uniref:Secreted protein n=1 Tax=Ensete ventricosum TaxID=4639 RepID=A0A426ZCY9_ENSVE|nr:hypothetical protein B296_00014743 [Ensete ventricosum]